MTPTHPARTDGSSIGTSGSTTVILLNWNGASDTLECLQSCLALQDAGLRFIVCDNASRASDVETLRQGMQRLCMASGCLYIESTAGDPHSATVLPPRAVVLLHTGANLGFAGGVNVGLRLALLQADMQRAWILNNDSVVLPDTLAALQRRMDADGAIGICGSTLVYFHARDQVQALGGARYQPWRGRSMALGAFSRTEDRPKDPTAIEAQMDYVVGASMLVSRRFLESVGLMDERYFLYSEEHDWAHRGRQAGFRLAWAPDSVVFHKHGATIGSSASGGSPLSMFYLYRNKAVFTALHHRWRLPVVLAWLLWEASKQTLKGHPEKTWAALRGLFAFPYLGRF